MRELLAVIIISCMVSTVPLQGLGFITPYWACGLKDDNYTTTENVSCNLGGIFYTCAGGSCHASVLEKALLGLCLTSLIVTCATAGYMIKSFRDKMYKNGKVDWTLGQNYDTLSLGIFLCGQILAGIAAIIIFIKYKVIGWSAILFTTISIPIVIAAMIIASILFFICCCAICCKGAGIAK